MRLKLEPDKKHIIMKKSLITSLFVFLVFLFVGCQEQSKDKNTEIIISTNTESESSQVSDTLENEETIFQISKAEEETTLEKPASIDNIPAWTIDRVNFRSFPHTDADIIRTLSKRSEVTLIGEVSGWYKVRLEDKEGYISADYITTEEPTRNSYVVCIDPGHQKSGDSKTEPNGPGSSEMKARVTGGTTGRTTGVAEYQLNLEVAKKLRNELENRGYTVVITRESHDVNISNMERAKFATNEGADITVRIHANGSDNSSLNGAFTMVPSSSNPYVASLAADSYDLGKSIIDEYCKATGMKNQGVTKTDTMTGINWCTMPVTIIEMGYMTNPTDDTNMQNSFYQDKMASGIATGIDMYFGL